MAVTLFKKQAIYGGTVKVMKTTDALRLSPGSKRAKMNP